jgi:hypothetical protein
MKKKTLPESEAGSIDDKFFVVRYLLNSLASLFLVASLNLLQPSINCTRSQGNVGREWARGS